MKKEERLRDIVEMVNTEGDVSFAKLKARFSRTSEMTLRRELAYLDGNRQLVRVHGGVKSLDGATGTEERRIGRSVRNVHAKEIIARKVLRLLKPNTAIYLDAGTTAMTVAGVLPDECFLIFTNGIACALELTHLTQSHVHVIGGKMDPVSRSVHGAKSLAYLENVNFQIAIMGVTGYSADTGFTCGYEDECELKRMAIRQADTVLMLMDTSKIGLCGTFTFAAPEDIQYIIGDDEMDAETLKRFREDGITVL